MVKKTFPVPAAKTASTMAVSIKAAPTPQKEKASVSLDRGSILAARTKKDTVLVSFRCDKADLLRLRVLKRTHKESGDPRTQDQLLAEAVHAFVAHVEIPEDPCDIL